MSVAAILSPPPSNDPSNAESDEMEVELDEQITAIRLQIRKMTDRRRLLSAALLGSSKIQSKLKTTAGNGPGQQDSNPLISSSQKHSQSNTHRLAFGVTSFPFTDPSPHSSSGRLLGIRFDICGRTGKFDKPYYLLLKRIHDNSNDVRVYRHTIPAFIPLRDYEDRFLPRRDEGYWSDASNDDTNLKPQNLHKLVRKVRQDLVSWTRRREAVELLREELGLPAKHEINALEREGEEPTAADFASEMGKYGIKKVAATTAEARYVRVEWTDGRVGRLKISNQGIVVRAVIYGQDGRMKEAELMLAGDRVRIEELDKRIKRLNPEVSV